MNIWLQHADLKSEDISIEGTQNILNKFQEIDWSKENKLYQELENAEEENCPPGFGIVTEHNGILHVCPDENLSSLIFLHEKKAIKLLGFLPWTRDITHTKEDVDRLSVLNIIQLFCDGFIHQFYQGLSKSEQTFTKIEHLFTPKKARGFIYPGLSSTN